MKNQTMKFAAVNMPQILRSPRWLAMMFLLPLLIMVHFAMAAPAAPAADKFDHANIGFTLNGAHASARCTACHINNVFKGTPRDCATCHAPSNHMGTSAKNTGHIATNAQCDVCHKTTTWVPAFFSHVGVTPGTCETCHNGTNAKDKSSVSNHMDTALPCSDCHKSTVSFKNAVASLPANHLQTTQACSLCHASGYGSNQGVMNHTGITNNCNSCHTGQTFAVGMTPKRMQDAPTTHIATSQDCSVCHSSTASFAGAANAMPAGHLATTQPCAVCHTAGYGAGQGVMNHTGISTGCASCHTGQTFAVGMKPLAVPSGHASNTMVTNGNACETCHAVSKTQAGGFAGTAMVHTGITNNCTSCHNGQAYAVGVKPMSKPNGPPAHIPTTAACEVCHAVGSTNIGGFAGTQMNHTGAGITNNCASCHNDGMTWMGVTIVRKQDAPTTHMSTGGLDCSSCHSSFITFKGGSPTAMPAGHLMTTQACSLCHAAGYGAGQGVMNHAGIVNGCASCHTGQTFAVGMKPMAVPSGHAPNTMVTNGNACETCHLVSKTQAGGFAGTAMVHTGIINNCTSCHNGQTYATGMQPMSKPNGTPTHIPTTAACEVCHAVGQTSAGGFAGTLMKHTGIANNCASCHDDGKTWMGVTIVRKQDAVKTHQTTTLDCSSCHNSTVTFTGAAGILPTGHLITTQACSLCHAAGYGVGSGVMNHLGIVSGCTNCHNNQTFAVGMKPVSKPAKHLTTSLACENCHAASSTNVGGFLTTKMDHTGITSGCMNCHNGQTFDFGMTPKNKSNYTGHPVTTSDCTACHSATNFTTFFPGAGGTLPGNHIPLAAQACTLCHANGYSLTLTVMSHAGNTLDCGVCHGGQTFAGPQIPMMMTAKHIPYKTSLLNGSTMLCGTCHKDTASFQNNQTGAILHNSSPGHGSGQCTGCHLSGTTYTGNMTRKSLTHDSPGHTDCSDSGCHKPLGGKGTSWTKWK